MTTNSNQPLSSAAFEVNERIQVKGVIGPGEIDQNVEGKMAVVSDPNNFEQAVKFDEKYLSSRALNRMSADEEDAFVSEGLDAQ